MSSICDSARRMAKHECPTQLHIPQPHPLAVCAYVFVVTLVFMTMFREDSGQASDAAQALAISPGR